MYGLRTLKLSVNGNVRDFNIPKILTHNDALENLYLQVDNSQVDLSKEMQGLLPSKLNNITITGRALKFLSQNILQVRIYQTSFAKKTNHNLCFILF